MVKRDIDARIMVDIQNFLKEIGKRYTIDAVYVFGSHAKGTTHKWSDVDVAIISKDVNNRIDDLVEMLMIADRYETYIHPHPYNADDFDAGEYVIAGEILRTGIRVA